MDKCKDFVSEAESCSKLQQHQRDEHMFLYNLQDNASIELFLPTSPEN